MKQSVGTAQRSAHSVVQAFLRHSVHWHCTVQSVVLYYTPGIANLENSEGGISVEGVFWSFG